MTSLNALTLTVDQWHAVDIYIGNVAQRIESEGLGATPWSAADMACGIAARVIRGYQRALREACDAATGETATVDHAGVEVLRSLSRDFGQFDDLTTWDDLRTRGRHYRAEGDRPEYAGPAPDAETLTALLAEENARRTSWRKIALPIIRAIETGGRAADRAA